MTKETKAMRWIALTLIAGFTGACIEDTGAGSEPPRPQVEEPGKTAQALGGWTLLWLGQATQTVKHAMHVGETYTVVRNIPFTSGTGGGGMPCDTLTVLNTGNGTTVSVPPLNPGQCLTLVGAGSDSTTIFVAEWNSKAIYKLTPGMTWSLLTSTGPTPTIPDTILANGSNVYWGDGASVYRAPRQGGASTLVSSDARLLAIDDTSVYFARSAFPNPTALIKVPLLGVSETPLATAAGGFGDASLQGNYIYFVETGSTNRLRRVATDDGSLKEFRSATSVRYRFPRSDGSVLYWREEPVGGSPGDSRIRRQGLTSRNVVSFDFPLPFVVGMRLRADGLYAIGRLSNNTLTPDYELRRTSL